MVQVDVVTDQSTDDDAVPTNEPPSAKKIAEKKVRKVIPGEGEVVYPLTKVEMIDDMRWRPFDDYVLKRGWDRHAARLRGLRDKPIMTPFGKKITWDQLLDVLSGFVDALPDGSLKEWELSQLEDMKAQPVRALYRPMMHNARLQLYSNRFYPKSDPPQNVIEVSKIRPLSHYSEIVIRPDAKSANVGFPYLKALSKPGEHVTESPVYQQILEDASSWKTEVLAMRKMTPTLVMGMSPPTAVFERAQSEGRAVEDVSKKVAFNGMLYTQPVYRTFEAEVKEYMYGDRDTRLHQMQALLHGDVELVADGDDIAVRLKDGTILMADASAFESSVSTSEVEDWISWMEDRCDDSEMLYRASLYGGCTEMVGSVAMVSNIEEPIRGVRSGDPGTHVRDTYHEINRAYASDRSDQDTFLKDISKFGIYKLESHWSEALVIGQLMVSLDYPDQIFGSIVRKGNSLWQRESVVLEKRMRKDLADLEEDRRVVQICSDAFGHPQFEPFCQWVKTLWQIRHDREAVAQAAFETAVAEKNRSGAVLSGKHEREAIKATLDLLA